MAAPKKPDSDGEINENDELEEGKGHLKKFGSKLYKKSISNIFRSFAR